MKDWSLRQRIGASFLAILVIMLAMAASDFYRLSSVDRSAAVVRDLAVPGWYHSAGIRASWNEGFLLTEEFLDIAPGQRAAQLEAIRAIDRSTDEYFKQFNALSLDADTRAAVQALAQRRADYIALRDRVLQSGLLDVADGQNAVRQQLRPAFLAVRGDAERLVAAKRHEAEAALADIDGVVENAKGAIITAITLALLAAVVCGFFLMRAVLNPMRSVVAAIGAMEAGDLTQRLRLARHDEFNRVEQGFNAMGESLTGLVGQAQRSAIQVATSVTQIAATSRQQEATATEVAATTTQIGATSREISATARYLICECWTFLECWRGLGLARSWPTSALM